MIRRVNFLSAVTSLVIHHLQEYLLYIFKFSYTYKKQDVLEVNAVLLTFVVLSAQFLVPKSCWVF